MADSFLLGTVISLWKLHVFYKLANKIPNSYLRYIDGQKFEIIIIYSFSLAVKSLKKKKENYIYSQVHKYWDIDTILTFLALYTTTMDFKWNEQDVL